MIPKRPEVVYVKSNSDRKLYFDNNVVEDLLLKYVWGGCTEVALRDQIMSHANELIKQVIRAHNLHRIYPGSEESAFGDLAQTAWIQIERTLYKYRARPHCANCYSAQSPNRSCLYNLKDGEYGIISPINIIKLKLRCPKCHKVPDRILYRGISKIFNLWSQISRTVILAYIKKESRDKKNSETYRGYLDYRHKPNSVCFRRFMEEAEELFKYNSGYVKILEALKKLSESDDRPYDGLISKLVTISGMPRSQIVSFLKMVRLQGDVFTDSPINERPRYRVRNPDPDPVEENIE